MINEAYLTEWKNLALSGKFEDANYIYYERLFPDIIKIFEEKYNKIFGQNIHLISILGFSPEPIILTAKALQPSEHLIITSNNKGNSISIIEDFLDSEFHLEVIDNINFKSIYKTMKESIIQSNIETIVIDITGGKKSMVSAASIFGRDYNCNIVYVDFTSYIKELRKPEPGSEILDIVYSPSKDNPLLFKI